MQTAIDEATGKEHKFGMTEVFEIYSIDSRGEPSKKPVATANSPLAAQRLANGKSKIGPAGLIKKVFRLTIGDKNYIVK